MSGSDTSDTSDLDETNGAEEVVTNNGRAESSVQTEAGPSNAANVDESGNSFTEIEVHRLSPQESSVSYSVLSSGESSEPQTSESRLVLHVVLALDSSIDPPSDIALEITMSSTDSSEDLSGEERSEIFVEQAGLDEAGESNTNLPESLISFSEDTINVEEPNSAAEVETASVKMESSVPTETPGPSNAANVDEGGNDSNSSIELKAPPSSPQEIPETRSAKSSQDR